MNRGSPSTKPRTSRDLERALSNVRWALRHGLDPRELVPMLERLLTLAEPGSHAACFAARQLAPLVLSTAPWRAARLARDVLRHADDGEAYAVLGLALTLLGHYRAAERAYRRALALNPSCVSTQHNLGHLLDAGLGRPEAALPFLRRAFTAVPEEREIAASYAHALARAGQHTQAREILVRVGGFQRDTAAEQLRRWLAADPPGSRHPPDLDVAPSSGCAEPELRQAPRQR